MSAACNAFKDDNHAFFIYDMPTGESASIPYFWGKQKPAFTTNRLYLGSVNTLTAWLQMYNAIETSLYQNKPPLFSTSIRINLSPKKCISSPIG